MNKHFMTSIAVLLSTLSFHSHATMIIANSAGSTNQLGDFELNATWDGTSLHLGITNTSENLNGGYITGLLLRLPGNVTYESMSSPNEFDLLWYNLGPYERSPYGQFDYGFSLIANDPSLGIGIGETGHFAIGILNNLPIESGQWTAEDFEYYLLQDANTPSVTDAHLLVQFSGFNQVEEDLVPSFIAAEDGPIKVAIQVPETSTPWFILYGLLWCLLRRRTRLEN